MGKVTLAQRDTTLVFHYRNEGDAPFFIIEMFPTCVCTVPTYSESPVMPGDSSSFTVRYSFERIGPVSGAVTISYASPESEEVYITRIGIKGEVIESE